MELSLFHGIARTGLLHRRRGAITNLTRVTFDIARDEPGGGSNSFNNVVARRELSGHHSEDHEAGTSGDRLQNGSGKVGQAAADCGGDVRSRTGNAKKSPN